MTHITCRLTAKNREQLRNPTLGNRVWRQSVSSHSSSHESSEYTVHDRLSQELPVGRTFHMSPLFRRLRRFVVYVARASCCWRRRSAANAGGVTLTADVTSLGRPFHTFAAATGNARPPIVDRRQVGTSSCSVEADLQGGSKK